MALGGFFDDADKKPSPSVVESRIRAAQISQLYTQSLPGVIAALMSAMILAAALRDVVPAAHLLIWLGCYVAVQLPRYGLMAAFHKANPTGEAAIPWERRFAVATAASGLVWGMAGVFLYPKDYIVYQFLIALFLAGIAAAAAVVYSFHWATYLATVVAVLFPLSGRFVYEGDDAHIIMGTVVSLFALILIVTGRSMHRLHTDSLRLGFENSDLVDSLVLQNTRADELNRCLKDEILEREKAEEELKESKELYRVFLQNFQGIAYRRDLNSKPLFFHGAVEAISGYTEEDFVLGNRAWNHLIHAEDFARITASEEQIRSLPTLGSQREYRILQKEGGTRWVCELMSNTCDSAGKPLYVQGSIYDVTDRKLAEESLKASLDEKEALLREIHHRVKNNLQVISSLLRLQARHIPDEGHRLMFLESQNRLESMVLIHELLYRSKDLAKIDLNGYMNGLVNLLLSSFGIGRDKVSFETAVAPVSMSVDTAIPCGLITNELVSNCLKHAFPEGRTGTVRIVFGSKDGSFQLVVSDDGIGLPQNLDFTSAHTLGLRLVNTLTKQLQGDVRIHRSSGTEIAIKFREVKSTKQS